MDMCYAMPVLEPMALLMKGLKHTVIASWYWREGYLTAMADLIEAELRKFEKPDDVEIFFSAHGVPTSYVEEFGDPYKEEMEQCVDMVMDRIRRRSRNNRHTLAYQSRVGPVGSLHLQSLYHTACYCKTGMIARALL